MIYICIPTHNEQQTVGVVLWKLRQVLTEFPRDYQLLVADDASTDKTPEVLEPYTRVLPLTVVRCDRQVGQAASLELLLREAVRRSEYPKRDIIITLQADFSEEPDDVVPMIKRIEAGADVVVGNKVSMTRPTRLRRLARALGSFFSRGQQWPEGVATPFEGYRAYRLYAVKRAIEESGARRLVRYDSWAGHAELLRAVLPHARRVEAMDIEDRPDRLQRPRRERPFAAAMQVRPMMAGIEPVGLVGVEELDRLAATASRSRDRASSRRVEPAGATGPDRGNGRSRQRTGNGRERSAPPREERPAKAPAAPRGEGRNAARRNSGAEAPRPQAPRSPRPDRPARPPRAARKTVEKPAATEETPPQPVVAEVVATDEVLATETVTTPAPRRPKRKRRRKRKSANGAGAAAGSEQTAPSPDAVNISAEAVEETGDESERTAGEPGSTRTGEAKRKRRRGGRGRRRGPKPAANGEPGADAGAAQPVTVESPIQPEAGNEA